MRKRKEGNYTIEEGNKYDPSLKKRDIAKVVRSEIKLKIESGEFPDMNFSVKTKRFSIDTLVILTGKKGGEEIHYVKSEIEKLFENYVSHKYIKGDLGGCGESNFYFQVLVFPKN